jgi:hypothetical protein
MKIPPPFANASSKGEAKENYTFTFAPGQTTDGLFWA